MQPLVRKVGTDADITALKTISDGSMKAEQAIMNKFPHFINATPEEHYKGYKLTLQAGGHYTVHKNGELQHGMGGSDIAAIKRRIDEKEGD